jgi:TolB-like protein/DNA-binding SARP family transcriptional activator
MATADGVFRLRVLGGFALEGPSGAPAPGRPQRRGDAVLAALAVYGDLGCSRERLAALLWPESDEGRAQQGLRDALYAIRRAIHPDVVVSAGRVLRLDPAVLATDVQAFRRSLDVGRDAEAARGYAGPLLDGFHLDDAPEFERWLDDERARLARQCAEALQRLAVAAERAGAWVEAAAWWGRAVEHDPINSHFVLGQARALTALGDRANALRAADAHARRLREELELEPDEEFLAEIERIRRGEVPARPAGAPAAASHSVAAPPAAAGRAPQRDGNGDRRADGNVATAAGRPSPTGLRRRLPWAGAAAAIALAAALEVGPRLGGHPRTAHPPRTAVALLPCHDLGGDSSHAFFAAGLHDELLTRLYKVASLTVVGRMSVAGYRDTTESPRRIAEELGVGSIAECSVEVIGNRLRVSMHVLDPFTGVTLWAERYDATMDDVLAVQSDIAERIVATVGATLTSAEQGAIATASTRNPQAYAFYLQGLDYFRRPGLLRANLEAAGHLYEEALALDPTFARADAALASVDFALHDLGYDPTPARLARATAEAGTALSLAPALPEAHFAIGLARYAGHHDVRGALREFETAARGAPNDAELWIWVGLAHAALHEQDSMMVAFDRARRLDPRNANLFHIIGDHLHYLHRYRAAIEAYRREIALAPDVAQARLSMAWSYILWKGDLDTLRAVLRGLPEAGDAGMGGPSVAYDRLMLVWMERRPDSVLAMLRRLGEDSEPFFQLRYAAPAQLMRGDSAAARALYAAAATTLGARERANPDDFSAHVDRGVALAALGRRDEALEEARWIARTKAYREDPNAAAGRAQILAVAGETDAARADLERVLAGPSTVTVPLLRLSPDWSPVVANPHYRDLLVKYADPEIPGTP